MQIKMLGCDISHWQGNVNFEKLKNKIDFIILKLGGSDGKNGTLYIDSQFKKYYNECQKYCIPVGCYWFAGKSSIFANRGTVEADYVKKCITGLKFEMPVFLDYEQGYKKYKRENTDFVRGFCKRLEASKYFVGIYGSDIDDFKETLILPELSEFTIWVARYGTKPAYVKSFGLWQYSSKGKLDGINGNVDMDYAYYEYPKIIRRAHLNGY